MPCFARQASLALSSLAFVPLAAQATLCSSPSPDLGLIGPVGASATAFCSKVSAADGSNFELVFPFTLGEGVVGLDGDAVSSLWLVDRDAESPTYLAWIRGIAFDAVWVENGSKVFPASRLAGTFGAQYHFWTAVSYGIVEAGDWRLHTNGSVIGPYDPANTSSFRVSLNASYADGSPVTPVPEPKTAAVQAFGLALLGGVAWRRYRRRTSAAL